MASNKTSLLEKYAPRTIDGLLGQVDAIDQLTAFAAEPYPCAFLFEGETGTGKSTAAVALARAIGVDVDQAEFGGYHQIAASDLVGSKVKTLMDSLRFRPFTGSGWKVLVCNEVDNMTSTALFAFLDCLEDLPQRCVVIFTTNSAKKIQARFRDRCERIEFLSAPMLLLPSMQELTDRIWAEEGCTGAVPDVSELPLQDEKGNVSYRRLLQVLTPLVRSATRQNGESRKLPAILAS